MAKLTSIAATRLFGAVAMLRARPINEVRARAERIQLLCVFCGFGSRRSDGAVVCKRDVCALHEAACCSLWQRTVALQRVWQRATAGIDRCVYVRDALVRRRRLVQSFGQKAAGASCAKTNS